MNAERLLLFLGGDEDVALGREQGYLPRTSCTFCFVMIQYYVKNMAKEFCFYEIRNRCIEA